MLNMKMKGNWFEKKDLEKPFCENVCILILSILNKGICSKPC